MAQQNCKARQLNVQVLENGYLITNSDNRTGHSTQNVAESFESLTKHLKENLQKPGEC